MKVLKIKELNPLNLYMISEYNIKGIIWNQFHKLDTKNVSEKIKQKELLF